MQDASLAELSDIFLRIINRYNDIEKEPYSYGTDILLHPSETHTIEFIGNNPDINVTRLASLLGITKGAVSKRIKQLRKNGLVTKSISPETENEVVINLTNQGIKIYAAHKEYSAELNKSISKIYSNLPDETINELKRVGIETEKIFLNISEERKRDLI